MNIDAAFGTVGPDVIHHFFDKSHYYLGTISSVGNSAVKVQIENLSILQSRILDNESIYPNTVNYFVLVDGTQGIFIGKVSFASIKDSESIHVLMKSGKLDRIYPEEDLDILAICKSNQLSFSPSGFTTVGIHDKVYVAPLRIVKTYIDSLELLDEAKKEKSLSSFSVLSNAGGVPIGFKPATLFSRHLMVIGTTGSGKSTSALSIIDKLVKNHIKVLMIDPTGEYRSSFSTAEIRKLSLGIDTKIAPGSLSINQWIGLLNASPGIQAPAIMTAIQALRFQQKNGIHGIYHKKFQQYSSIADNIASLTPNDTEFSLELLTKQLLEEAVSENSSGKLMPNDFKLNAIRLLTERLNQKMQTSDLRNFFSNRPQYSLLAQLSFFLNNQDSLYIDASQIGATDDTGGMIVDLISRYINQNKTSTQDSFVLFVDEVHRYAVKQQTDQDEYYQGLSILAREGRKQGIYLLLTTQSPNDVSNIVFGQIGSLLIHRLTQSDELYAVKNFVDDGTRARIPFLGQGEAVLSSVNLLHNIQLRINPTDRTHHNSSPSLQR